MTASVLSGRSSTTKLVDLQALDGGFALLSSGALRSALEVEPLNLALQDDPFRDQMWRQYRRALSALTGPVSLYSLTAPLAGETVSPSAAPVTDSGPSWCDRRFRADLVAAHQIQTQRHFCVVWAKGRSPLPGLGVRGLGRVPLPRPSVDLEQRSRALEAGLSRIGLHAKRLDDGSWFAALQACTGGRSGRRPHDFPSWLAPTKVIVEADSLCLDGRFCRSLQLSGFPRRVEMGWLAPLVLAPPCTIRMVQHVYPQAKLASLGHLRRRIRGFETSLQVDRLRGHRPDQGTRAALSDALELEQRVLLEEERLFRLGVTVTVEADSRSALEDAWHWVRAILAEVGCTATPLTHRQVDGWRSTLPLGIDPLDWSRDMTAGALATALPFMRAGLRGADGALLGPSLISKELVIADPFSAANPNYNTIVLGTSGGGKSFTAKLLAARLSLRGVRVRCVDPSGEYLALASLLGGQFLELGAAPGSGLNVMGPVPESADLVGVEHRAAKVLPILERLARGRAAGGGLTQDALDRLEQQLLLVLRADPKGARLRDLVEALESAGMPLEAARLRRFTSGTERGFFDGESAVFASNFAAVSLAELQRDREHLLTALVHLVLVHLEAELSQNRGLAHLLVVDEAEVLLSSERSAMALESLTRRLRKLGAGLMVISQVVEDFLSSPVGNVVIRNCHTKILLRQEEVAIPALRQAFGLSSVEADLLLSCPPGCGLIVVGRERAAFNGAAPPEWVSALSTDPLSYPPSAP